MIIRSLHLEHFRCFEDIDIEFDNQLTILVGANGAGKTAVLDALSIFLKNAGNPDQRESARYTFPSSDLAIGFKPEDFSYRLGLQTSGSKSDSAISVNFAYNQTSQSEIMITNFDTINAIKQILDEIEPVFVAYMAGRFISEKDTVLRNNIYTPSQNAAFINSFNRTIDYDATLAWFNNADADEARAMRDNGQKNELPELRAVRDALSKALLGQYERPRMLGNPPEMIVYKKGTDIAYKVSQLSDGYRAMLALVMDLARRMVQSRIGINKLDEILLNTPAVVLIDEVELHLHPAWQQTVLTTLMGIFPNTQFIITTHSPQVLTSIPSKHIRILKDGQTYTVDEQTEGAEASRLLKHVFGVESRPYGLDIVQTLNSYIKMVYNEQWDTPEADELRKKLTEHYGNGEPALMELELHIENAKWERGL